MTEELLKVRQFIRCQLQQDVTDDVDISQLDLIESLFASPLATSVEDDLPTEVELGELNIDDAAPSLLSPPSLKKGATPARWSRLGLGRACAIVEGVAQS